MSNIHRVFTTKLTRVYWKHKALPLASSFNSTRKQENVACNSAVLICKAEIKAHLPSCKRGKLKPSLLAVAPSQDEELRCRGLFPDRPLSPGLFLETLPGPWQLQEQLCAKPSFILCIPRDAQNMLCTLKTGALLAFPSHSPSSL